MITRMSLSEGAFNSEPAMLCAIRFFFSQFLQHIQRDKFSIGQKLKADQDLKTFSSALLMVV